MLTLNGFLLIILLNSRRIYGAFLLHARITVRVRALLSIRINTLLAALLVVAVNRSVSGLDRTARRSVTLLSLTVNGLCLCLNRL